MPEPKHNTKYPFYKMKIGESFEFSLLNANEVRSSAHSYGKVHDMRFITRKISSTRGRVWRVRKNAVME